MKSKHQMKRPVILILLGLMILSSGAQAQMSIFTSGGWSPYIGSMDLITGPGSDLSSTYESGTEQTALTIIGTSGSNWRVDAKLSEVAWHSDLTLSMRRTGDGIGGGTVFGGLSYLDLGITDRQILSGSGDISDIPVQLKLDGVSLRVPPTMYSATITYTLVDN